MSVIVNSSIAGGLANSAQWNATSTALVRADGVEVPATPEAAAVIRGSVQLTYGVTPGVVDSATRIANGSQLQANITAANTNNKHIEFEPGLFEFSRPAGLVIPESWEGRTLRGTKQSVLRQFAVDAPILTVGDFGGGGASNINIDGLHLQYGTSQSGLASANALMLGSMAWSKLSNLRICVEGERPYRAIYAPSSSTFGIFSNSFEDIQAWQGQVSCVAIAKGGTGNRWENLHMSVGNATTGVASCTGPVLDYTTPSQDDSTFGQVNIEWAKSPSAVYFELARGLVIDSLHIEYWTANGWAAAPIFLSLSHVQINSLMLRSPQFIAAEGAAGPVGFFNGYGQRSVNVKNMVIHLEKHNVLYPSPISVTTSLIGVNTGDKAETPRMHRIEQFNITGPDMTACLPYLQISAAAPYATYNIPIQAALIQSINTVAKTEAATISAEGTTTIYSAHNEPTIVCPVAPASAFDIVLSTKRGPAASGFENTPPNTGQMAFVSRSSGTVNGNAITVKSDATAIETITAADTKRGYRFDGSAWIAS